MAKSLPPLNWFRAFEASARRLSFTAAAQEIGITQSAVSQQIRALEQRFGVVLFQRRAQGLALTDAGRTLLPQVEAALAMLSSAADRFDVAAAQGELVVRASISVTEWVIAPALPGFHAAYPDIAIRFQTAIWPDEFQRATADVEIRFGSPKQVGDGAEALLPNTLIPLRSPEAVAPFDNLPRIEAVGTSVGWAAWSRAVGYAPPAPSVFVDSYGLGLRLAADGVGATLASAALVGHALHTGRLVRAHPATIPGGEGYFLSINRPTSAAQAFRDWLMDTVAQHAPSD